MIDNKKNTINHLLTNYQPLLTMKSCAPLESSSAATSLMSRTRGTPQTFLLSQKVDPPVESLWKKLVKSNFMSYIIISPYISIYFHMYIHNTIPYLDHET